MKICLINPPRLLTLGSLSLRATPPLGLAYIAGSLKHAGHQVQVIDGIAEAATEISVFKDDIMQHGLTNSEIAARIHPATELIGISVMFTNNWLATKQLIDYLGDRFPNAKIVIGGEHATAVPNHCIKQTRHLDVCVLGEGEDAIVELAAAYQNGSAIADVNGIVFRNSEGNPERTGPRTRIRELEQIPWPAWDIFPMEAYQENKLSYGVDRGNSLPVMATRGCPYTCTFCSSPQMWGTKYTMRTPQDVLTEILFLKKEYNISNFDFYDLTAIVNKRWIIEFSKELIDNNANITWQIPAGTRSEVIDREVAHYLYKSGCRNITYAPESGSPEILHVIKKKVKIPSMLRSIAESRKEGLNVKLNMIIGFPDEGHKHIWETIWFLVKCSWYGAHDSVPSIFSPYPGSALYEALSKEGRISIEDESYMYSIIYADTYSKNPVYSNHLSAGWVRFYAFLGFVVFYISNYAFRPMRFFRTMRNVITSNYESRGELTLGEMLKRKTVWTIKEPATDGAGLAKA